jgi:hypothetical protein
MSQQLTQNADCNQKAGPEGDLRQRLTAMLRCASGHGCTDAVPCSDKAMALLRKTLTTRES